jgi:CHAD domain-containing protein
LLGPEIAPVIEVLKALQVNLGDLNDTRVALNLLDETPERGTTVAHYRPVQIEETKGRLFP